MSDTSTKRYVAPGTINTITVGNSEVLHILILVGGTTDPVNADDLGSESHSYGTLPGPDKNFYWDHAFYKGIEEFKNKYVNLKIFNYHGWSGDNSVTNRKIAGRYLANRLCGAEGQKAFYERTYQNKDIHFHLLGHSHGGNVINEITQQIDKLGDRWPRKWQIKSIVYLSTPFFNKIHQVKVTSKTFHPDAEVLSLYNNYDLTQRMLADFSMEPLAGGIANASIEDVKTKAKKFIAASKEIPFEHLKEFSWTIGGARMISHENGVKLYRATIKAFEELGEVITAALDLISTLNQYYEFPLDKSVKGANGEKPSNKRKLISDASYARALRVFGLIERDILAVHTRLQNILRANTSGRFDKADYIAALFGITHLITTLNNLIDLNPDTLTPASNDSIWSLIGGIVRENIQNFDNTYAKPNQQFKGSHIENKISLLNVTARDKYDQSNGSKNFQPFISMIERIESNYAASSSDRNLFDLIFTLLANEDTAYTMIKEITSYRTMIDYAEYLLTGDLDDLATSLRTTLEHLDTVFTQRHTRLKIGRERIGSSRASKDIFHEGLTDERHKQSSATELKRGSLQYLLIESHSTSRRVLHPEVKNFLEKLGAKK